MNKTTKCMFAILALVVPIIGVACGYELNAYDLATLSLIGIGDIDAKGLNELIEKQGRAFEEFKQANDQKLEEIKKQGEASADVQQKLAKIDEEMKRLSDDYKEMLLKANRPNFAGENEQTKDQADYKKAFNKYLRKGDENGLDELQVKAYQSGKNPDGGYLILPEMDTAIDRVVSVVSAVGRLARNVTISTDQFKKTVKTSGMTARRVGPGATRGETTTPNFAELTFTAHEGEAEPWVHNSTLEDASYNLEMDLADEAAIAFAELAGDEYINGTGSDEAQGILGYSIVANSSYAWGKVGYIASGGSGAFASSNPADKVIDLQHALKQQYRNGAVFLMADSTLGAIRQLKDGSGQYYLWQADPTAGFGGRLLGSPVEIDDNMPAIASNSYSIAYANFQRAYLIINRTGTVLIRDNITAKGKTKFNFRRRWGGGVQNFEALKLMKFASS